MKSVSLLVLVYFSCVKIIFAQEIEYFSTRGVKSEKNNCEFYTIGKKVGEKYVDTLKSYYCQSNTIKSIIYFQNGIPEGKSQHYFKNGFLERVEYLREGRPVGTSTLFYPNGIKRAIFEYDNDDSKFDWSYRIVETWDSIGQPTVKNGSGFCNSLETNFGIEIGFVKDGLKDSTWLTFDKVSKKRILEELFRAGKFIKGKRFDNSTVTEYFFTEVSASPKDGLKAFYQEIMKTIKYPKGARKARITGKVYIQFIVFPDGSLQEVQCIKGIGGGCDEAAIEAVKKSKPWIPGNQKGLPVKQRMTLPIEFKI